MMMIERQGERDRDSQLREKIEIKRHSKRGRFGGEREGIKKKKRIERKGERERERGGGEEREKFTQERMREKESDSEC